ncbi:Lar family restriction alleviation protein [Agrobacterium sp. 22-209-1]
MSGTTKQSLKPCPFCGGAPETDSSQSYRKLTSGNLDHQAAIYCTSCDAVMTMCAADTPQLDDEDRLSYLIDRWNGRSNSPIESIAVPEGFVVVPVEADDAMIAVGLRAMRSFGNVSNGLANAWRQMLRIGRERGA